MTEHATPEQLETAARDAEAIGKYGLAMRMRELAERLRVARLVAQAAQKAA